MRRRTSATKAKKPKAAGASSAGTDQSAIVAMFEKYMGTFVERVGRVRDPRRRRARRRCDRRPPPPAPTLTPPPRAQTRTTTT